MIRSYVLLYNLPFNAFKTFKDYKLKMADIHQEQLTSPTGLAQPFLGPKATYRLNIASLMLIARRKPLYCILHVVRLSFIIFVGPIPSVEKVISDFKKFIPDKHGFYRTVFPVSIQKTNLLRNKE